MGDRKLPGSNIRYRVMRQWFATICLAGIILATTAAACSSGIVGTVTLGPTCPVERPGMHCERPYAAAIGIYTDSGALVTTIHSADDGRFHVKLAPGTYVLKPQPADPARPYPIGKPATVTVKTGSFTHVSLQYDTGIR
ncbi:MAG: hypothetical protein M3Z41_01620 [Candidatus Eremiobacteraeota bacterium]|nr:hypothetical protein [Candidatus Eremiobacteraeota bacterium]